MGYLLGLGGGKVGTKSRICPKGWMVCVAWGDVCCYKATSKLIIDKSMVGIILCLIVLRNYPKVQYTMYNNMWPLWLIILYKKLTLVNNRYFLLLHRVGYVTIVLSVHFTYVKL